MSAALLAKTQFTRPSRNGIDFKSNTISCWLTPPTWAPASDASWFNFKQLINITPSLTQCVVHRAGSTQIPAAHERRKVSAKRERLMKYFDPALKPRAAAFFSDGKFCWRYITKVYVKFGSRETAARDLCDCDSVSLELTPLDHWSLTFCWHKSIEVAVLISLSKQKIR